MKPWLLETNGNPSLNIFFEPDEWKVTKREESVTSQIDLYVKSKVLGDVVNMVKRNKRKEIEEDVDEWRTYEKNF